MNEQKPSQDSGVRYSLATLVYLTGLVAFAFAMPQRSWIEAYLMTPPILASGLMIWHSRRSLCSTLPGFTIGFALGAGFPAVNWTVSSMLFQGFMMAALGAGVNAMFRGFPALGVLTIVAAWAPYVAFNLWP